MNIPKKPVIPNLLKNKLISLPEANPAPIRVPITTNITLNILFTPIQNYI